MIDCCVYMNVADMNVYSVYEKVTRKQSSVQVRQVRETGVTAEVRLPGVHYTV